ncbi:uncharacterized protein G2W53_017964 [Senna tora]|uniref:Uncharacterized protein n=1 Tax=Senna tora TaxID=362788 RepID=A0A834TR43_9FABA|nr:uncharacterized protein G2W53_017964 [Senna tora]
MRRLTTVVDGFSDSMLFSPLLRGLLLGLGIPSIGVLVKFKDHFAKICYSVSGLKELRKEKTRLKSDRFHDMEF